MFYTWQIFNKFSVCHRLPSSGVKETKKTTKERLSGTNLTNITNRCLSSLYKVISVELFGKMKCNLYKPTKQMTADKTRQYVILSSKNVPLYELNKRIYGLRRRRCFGVFIVNFELISQPLYSLIQSRKESTLTSTE